MSRTAAGVAVLHEDAWFLVLHKPSGLPTTSPGDEPTLTAVARELDPSALRLHPSSRLDAEVSGAVIFARTPSATEHLLAARRAGSYRRGYLAIASAAPEPPRGEWHGAIGIDPNNPRKRAIARAGAPGAREAHTRFSTLQSTAHAVLLWLMPQTGRTHQLRVHAAGAGIPLLGDRHYGGAQRVVLADGRVLSARRTMLHCARVEIPDPVGGDPLRFEAPPPTDFDELWRALGGSALQLPAGDGSQVSNFRATPTASRGLVRKLET
jgi:23S rRNA-/tRNA-specific pseudouridylate synthase